MECLTCIGEILLYNLCTVDIYIDQIYIVISRKINKPNTHSEKGRKRNRDGAKRWKNIPGVDVARLFVNPAALYSTMFTRNRKKCPEKELTQIMSHSVC